MAPGEHDRQSAYATARFEKWALPCLARSLPSWVVPDHLTVVGIISATAVFGCYLATNVHPGWFWVASAWLVVHWFGDSLDGTLARVRKSERPRYGYYIDHITDAYSTVIVCLGLGLTSVMHFGVGVALALVYLVMSINVYLETHVYKQFQFGYGRLGPTEGRILLILLNTVAALFGPISVAGLDARLTLFDLIGAVGGMLMGVLLLARVVSNLRRLGRLDPPSRAHA